MTAEKNRKAAAAPLAGLFVLAGMAGVAIALPVHMKISAQHSPALRQDALSHGYRLLDQRSGESWGHQSSSTARSPFAFSTAAHFNLQLVDKDARNERLCKYSGRSYQLFGKTLFSRGTISCAPAPHATTPQ